MFIKFDSSQPLAPYEPPTRQQPFPDPDVARAAVTALVSAIGTASPACRRPQLWGGVWLDDLVVAASGAFPIWHECFSLMVAAQLRARAWEAASLS